MQQPLEILAQIETIEMNFNVVDPLDAAIQNIIAARVLVNFAMDAFNAADKKFAVVGEMVEDADHLLRTITDAVEMLTGKEIPNAFVVQKQGNQPATEKRVLQ